MLMRRFVRTLLRNAAAFFFRFTIKPSEMLPPPPPPSRGDPPLGVLRGVSAPPELRCAIPTLSPPSPLSMCTTSTFHQLSSA